MTPTLSELATQSASTDSSDDDGDYDGDYESSFEPQHIWDHAFVKQHPPTAVGGVAQNLRYIENFDDDSIPTEDGDGALIVTDPFVVTDDDVFGGTTVFVRNDDEHLNTSGNPKGDEFKVVNGDDPVTKIDDDQVVFDGNVFYATELGSSFDVSEAGLDSLTDLYSVEEDEEMAIKITGSTRWHTMRVLDAKGRGTADVERDENGNPVLNENGYPINNRKLIETHPRAYEDDFDGDWYRFQRHSELRPDVEGNRVLIALARRSQIQPDYDGDAYYAMVFAAVDDDRREELTTEYAERFNESNERRIEDDESDVEAREPDDFVAEFTVSTADGEETVEMVQLDSTDEFEPDEEMCRHRYHGTFLPADWGHYPSTEELNELREAQNFDPIN